MYFVASKLSREISAPEMRRDYLHDNRLDLCVAYLQHVFGDSLKGARVIDYGCGHGDWALAFRRAGAEHVLAIDAAVDNVRYLHDNSRAMGFDGLDVVQGDLLSQNIGGEKADIVWLYDVLPHVPRPLALLQALRDLAPGAAAQFYINAYDAGSLRQFSVETARQLYPHPGRDAFDLDCLSLTREARRRGGDNLMVSQIEWFSATGFAEILSGAGLEPVERPMGFHSFQGAGSNTEFQPHEALCRGVPAEGAMLWEEPPREYGCDLAVLAAMAREVNFSLTDRQFRTQAAMGLLNTHFANLVGNNACSGTAMEIYLYLFHILDVHGGLRQAEGLARDFIELTEAALSDAPRRQFRAANHAATIARDLCESSIHL